MAITGLLPSPPPAIRLDFSLLEPSTVPSLHKQTPPQVEAKPPSPPPRSRERSPNPVAKPQNKTVANAAPQKTRQLQAQMPTEAAKEGDTASPIQADAAQIGPADTTVASPSGSGDASATGVIEAYRRANFSAIRSAILANLRYPITARRQGWSGKVEIAFLVTPEGGVDQLRIKKSSGHRVLDEEAMAAIRRSAPFAPPRLAVLLVMPVAFELK